MNVAYMQDFVFCLFFRLCLFNTHDHVQNTCGISSRGTWLLCLFAYKCLHGY